MTCGGRCAALEMTCGDGEGRFLEPVSKVPARLSEAKGRDDRRNHIHKCCDIRLADMLFPPYAVVNERAQCLGCYF